MVSLIAIIVFGALGLVLNVVLLRVLAKAVGSGRATWGRSVLAQIVVVAIGVVMLAGTSTLPKPPNAAGALTLLALETGAICYALARVFQISFGRASLVVVSLLVISIGLAIPVRIWLLEAFLVPTGSMAPGLAGPHLQLVCSTCGGKVMVPVRAEYSHMEPNSLGICAQCRLVVPSNSPVVRDVCSADRFCVEKLLTPKRWDSVVYRNKNGADPYVFRVVGLPGETVFIAESAVWINGAKMPLPAHLTGTVYEDRAPFDRPIAFGDEAHPVPLAADEYFVLGDFSRIAGDSRYSGPVKKESLIGVVDLRYWPPSRVAVLR